MALEAEVGFRQRGAGSRHSRRRALPGQKRGGRGGAGPKDWTTRSRQAETAEERRPPGSVRRNTVLVFRHMHGLIQRAEGLASLWEGNWPFCRLISKVQGKLLLHSPYREKGRRALVDLSLSSIASLSFSACYHEPCIFFRQGSHSTRNGGSFVRSSDHSANTRRVPHVPGLC